MPRDRKFVNPLTQPSEPTTYPSTETPTLPATQSETYTYTFAQSQQRKRGVQAFEKTHERITLWIDSGLKQQFEALSNEQGRAKSGLLDEAIADLLAKYHPMTPVEERQPTPVVQEIRNTAEVETQPFAQNNLVSLQSFADLHTINLNEAMRLYHTGMIAGSKQGTGRQPVIMLAVKGRHDFWVQFHETQGFRACDDCPHK